jgi:FAD/FMN-containing dehydrogenase/ferredoxin
VAVGPFERRLYSRDVAAVGPFFERLLPSTTPLLVVQPVTEADIIATLRFASERGLAVFPRGISSAPLGNSVPTRDGITLDFSPMNRILEVDEAALLVRVEPGVRWADLAERLRPLGLSLLTSPSSRFSTVGGWAATGGLGIDAFRYGSFAEAILAARVALPEGEVLALEAKADRLEDFIGSEGQLGVFTELTLRVRRQPVASLPRLASFESYEQALAFLTRLAASDHGLSHAAFFDRARMAEQNALFRDHTGLEESIVPELDTVLLHFDDPDAERRFAMDTALLGEAKIRSDAASHYLWEERFFPLKAQRLGPSRLGAEVVLPLQALPDFLRRARRLAGRFGSEPTIEAITARTRGAVQCVTIASFPCDRTDRFDYLLRLILVQLLVHLGVRLGGRPYGLGIWNSPFFHRRYDSTQRRTLLKRKAELDPAGLLNPGKFFSLRTKLGGVPGWFFAWPMSEIGLHCARLLSPLLGRMAHRNGHHTHARWVVPPPDFDGGRPLLRETALRCTFCGACVSVCPAYYLTRDERVTGRGKLQLFEALSRGDDVSAGEATALFQCLRCRLCEEACQTSLALLDCYAVLEKQVEAHHGPARDLIESFVRRVDANQDRIPALYGLDREEWSPNPVATSPLPLAPPAVPAPGPPGSHVKGGEP